MNKIDEDDINKRLLKIRETFQLSQKEFSSKIGISQPLLAQFESGVRKLKTIHILRICDEFHLNKEWLETGIGGEENMFQTTINLHGISALDNPHLIKFINSLVELPPEKINIICSFMQNCFSNDQSEKTN